MERRTVADVIAAWRETFAPWQKVSDESAADLAGRINFYISTQLAETVVISKEKQ